MPTVKPFHLFEARNILYDRDDDGPDFEDQPAQPYAASWYKISGIGLGCLDLCTINVTVYGENYDLKKVFTESGHADLSEQARQYGIILIYTQDPSYSYPGMPMCSRSSYVALKQNMPWMMGKLAEVNDFYAGQHNKAQITARAHDTITITAKKVWTEEMEKMLDDGLNEISTEQIPIKLKVESQDITASDLIPTQNRLDPDKSIRHALENAKATRNLFGHHPILVKKPIITLNTRYIIDGHHAWAEVVVNRAKDQISCINLVGSNSPLDVIKHIKTSLAASFKDIKVATELGKLDLYTMTEEDCRKYVKAHLTPECEEVYLEFGIPDVVEHLIKGIMLMQERNRPISGAKNRREMPQFGTDLQRKFALHQIHDANESIDTDDLIINQQMNFSNEFINKIKGARELFKLNLIPKFFMFDPPEEPINIFTQYSNGQWVAVVLDSTFNPILRNDSEGGFRRIYPMNESEAIDLIKVDHRMKLPYRFLKKLSRIHGLVANGLMDMPDKSIRLDGDNETFSFMTGSNGRWILTNRGYFNVNINKINGSDGFYKEYSNGWSNSSNSSNANDDLYSLHRLIQ